MRNSETDPQDARATSDCLGYLFGFLSANRPAQPRCRLVSDDAETVTSFAPEPVHQPSHFFVIQPGALDAALANH